MNTLRMPAEWEKHEATWVAWPHETTDWPGKFLTVQWIYGEIVRHLSRVERVRILVQDPDQGDRVRKLLRKCGVQLGAIELFPIVTDRSWTRDFCPIFVEDEGARQVMLNWKFNAWAKYPNFAYDDAVTPHLQTALTLPMCTPELGSPRIVL